MLTAEQKEAAKIRRERRARGEYKQSVATRKKKSEATLGEKHPGFGVHPSDETKAKISEANKGKHPTNTTKAKMSRAHSGEKNGMFGRTHSPEACRKNSESNKKIWLDQQWYGTVTYGKLPCCVLFNFEFKERCRAYWGNESVLSHKTQAENSIIHGKHARLTVHHVYYQEKALCGWDADLEGYYAMINLGTERNPNMIRHNIKGDPNKFVILTNSEHGRIKSNKLEQIKYFEDLIEEQGGKCYFTKEEMVGYKIRVKSDANSPNRN